MNNAEDLYATTLATNMDEALANQDKEQAAALVGIKSHAFLRSLTRLSEKDVSKSSPHLCEEISCVLANMKMITRKDNLVRT